MPPDITHFLVSDIHIRTPEDPKLRLLLEAMDEWAKAKPKYIIFLGDIFDFYLGSHKYFRRKYASFFEGLSKLKKAGIKIIFIEGNHEYATDDITQYAQVVVESPDKIGLKLKQDLFSHGDLFNAPNSYHQFRGFLKSSFLKTIVKAIPGSLMNKYALAHASASRSRDVYRTLPHRKILEDASRVGQQQETKRVFFGHFHQSYNASVKNVALYCMESWDQTPNFLALSSDNEVFRANLVKNISYELRRVDAQTSEDAWIFSHK